MRHYISHVRKSNIQGMIASTQMSLRPFTEITNLHCDERRGSVIRGKLATSCLPFQWSICSSPQHHYQLDASDVICLCKSGVFIWRRAPYALRPAAARGLGFRV
jgi:hypothetical protein